MFKLVQAGAEPGTTRLVADAPLRPEDFDAVVAETGSPRVRAKKTGFVAARRALMREPVVTWWNGREMTAVAEPGDFVVANVTPDRSVLRDRDGNPNLYVIGGARFPDLYARDTGETEYGEIYRAIGIVEAVFLPGGFDIVLPKGDRQVADVGYLLRSGPEVYGNNAETFEKTYLVL